MWTNTYLFLPALFVYRMAIGYFRVENGGGVRAIRAFLVSLGVTICYSVLVFCARSRLELVDRPVGKTADSIPRGATQVPGM